MNCQVSEEAAVAKIKDRCGGEAGEEPRKSRAQPTAGRPRGHQGRAVLPRSKRSSLNGVLDLKECQTKASWHS